LFAVQRQAKRFLALFVLYLATVPTCFAAEPAKTERPPDDPLLRLNASFRKAHADARKEMLAKAGPVVLLDGDNLILIHNGKRIEARTVPEIYHTLKAVAHSPVAIQVMLSPFGDAAMNADRLAGLKEYREQLAQAEKALGGRGLSEEQLERSKKILSACQKFVDGVVAKERATRDEVHTFTRTMSPLVIANATDAARAQLDTMHQQMKKWRTQLSPEEWKALHIVIIGSAMPRKGNLAVQYFSRLLGEKGEGLRILYAESLWEEAKALNLLGTSLVDSSMAVAFFNDELRMHIDLLAPVADELLKKMAFEK
jgi:hypothetical protein